MRRALINVHQRSPYLAYWSPRGPRNSKRNLSMQAFAESKASKTTHQAKAPAALHDESHTSQGVLSTYLNYRRRDTADVTNGKKLSDHENKIEFHREDGVNVDRRPVLIRDIRGHEDEYSLEKQGFQVCPFTTPNLDFGKKVAVEKVYFLKIEELLKTATGAKRVHIYDHHVRSQSLETSLLLPPDGEIDIQGPVRAVHIDESAKSARTQVAIHLPKEAKQLLTRRFAVINAWKPLKTIVRDPLAVCDARKVEQNDLIMTPWGGRGPEGDLEDVTVIASERHEWFYVDGLRPEEVLLIKIFDSKDGGDSEFLGVPHSSFVDPRVREGERSRESVEVRALCFW